MNYNLYLFSNLVKFYDNEFANACYDEQWDNLPEMYEEFENSKFNDPNESEYDCIIEFLKDKYKQ